MKDLGEYWITNILLQCFFVIGIIVSTWSDGWEKYFIGSVSYCFLILQMNYLFKRGSLMSQEESR